MEVDELILAKCIDNKCYEGLLEIGKYYRVASVLIGQSNSSVIINGRSYNSIRFEFYDDKLEEFDIYRSKYSPYHKLIKKDKEIEKIDKGKFYGNRFPDGWEEHLINKIDEIIDVVNEIKKEGI